MGWGAIRNLAVRLRELCTANNQFTRIVLAFLQAGTSNAQFRRLADRTSRDQACRNCALLVHGLRFGCGAASLGRCGEVVGNCSILRSSTAACSANSKYQIGPAFRMLDQDYQCVHSVPWLCRQSLGTSLQGGTSGADSNSGGVARAELTAGKSFHHSRDLRSAPPNRGFARLTHPTTGSS